jgi:hypothetical protein
VTSIPLVLLESVVSFVLVLAFQVAATKNAPFTRNERNDAGAAKVHVEENRMKPSCDCSSTEFAASVAPSTSMPPPSVLVNNEARAHSIA